MTERTQPEGKGLILGGSLVVLGASVAFAGFKYFSRSPRPPPSGDEKGGVWPEHKDEWPPNLSDPYINSPSFDESPVAYHLTPAASPLSSNTAPSPRPLPSPASCSSSLVCATSSSSSLVCASSSSSSKHPSLSLPAHTSKSLSPSKSCRSSHSSSCSRVGSASHSLSPSSTSFSSSSFSCPYSSSSSSSSYLPSPSAASTYSASAILPSKPPPRPAGDTSLDSEPSSNFGSTDADKKREALRLSKLAAARHASEEYREALNLFTRALSLHQHYKYYTNRALTAVQESLYEDALKDARASIAIKPTPKGHHALGSALMGLRRYEDAVKDFEKVFQFPNVEARDIKLSSKLIVECQYKIAKKRRKQEKANAMKDPPPPYASAENLDSVIAEGSGILVTRPGKDSSLPSANQLTIPHGDPASYKQRI